MADVWRQQEQTTLSFSENSSLSLAESVLSSSPTRSQIDNKVHSMANAENSESNYRLTAAHGQETEQDLTQSPIPYHGDNERADNDTVRLDGHQV